VQFLDQRNFAARDAQFDLLRQQLEAMRNQESSEDLGQALREGGRLVQKTDAIAMRNETKAARDQAHIAKKEFEDQVAFSTIELHLYQPNKLLQTETVDAGSVYRQYREGFFSRLGRELRGGWDGLLDFFLGLAGIWPVLLVAGVVAPVIWRALRRRKAKASA
jgi:hypothetical protein